MAVEFNDNPFGLSRQGTGEPEAAFFHPSVGLGVNFWLLSRAWAALLIYQLNGDPRALIFAADQIDWVLGKNPLNLCMFEVSIERGAGLWRPKLPWRPDDEHFTEESMTMRRSKSVQPRAEVLESRALLSGTIMQSIRVSGPREAHPDFFRFQIPHGPPTPLRTGGAAALVSPGVLLVVINKPGNFPNETTIQDDGAGNVTVEWNGHNPPTFHGVSRIIVDARGKTNTVTFTLTGNVTVAQEVDVQLDGTNSDLIPNLGAFNATAC